MKIRTWTPEMTDKETADLGYWERNVLALHFADASKGDGWYCDDIPDWDETPIPRYNGWHRVLSLQNGSITFHIPDDFDIGGLPQIVRNWDGHTTHEKWARILAARGVEIEG